MIWKLRILAFYIVISFFITAFFVLFSLPMQIVRARYSFRYKVAEIFSYIYCYLIWAICGIKFKVSGLEKISNIKVPYIAAANHQSFWENFFMQLIIPQHTWVIKKELQSIPVFGWGIKSVVPIAVDRSNKRSFNQILEQGKKRLDEGNCVVIFPEGTRVKVNKNIKFKPSAAKLAIESKSGIALIAMNSGLVWPKGFWFKQPGTIKVNIIEFLNSEKVSFFEDARSLNEYMQNKINTEKERLVEKGV